LRTRDPNWPAVTAASGGVPQVDPHLYLHPRTLARLANFELRSKLIVEGVMAGQHRSPYSGVSVEFAQHRPYTPGDETRRLDWKVFARTDRLQVKQHEQETTLDLIVMVDSSGSMRYGSRLFSDASGTAQGTGPRGEANWTKFDHATALAAALAYITLHQGDRVGMVVFADQIRSIVNRSSSRATWRQIVDVLSLHPVDKPTSILRAVEQTAAKLSNRCLFAVVSDFFDDAESIRAAMGRLRHRGHDLICFQVLDRAEETFDLRDAAPFVGLEGEPVMRVDPRALRQAYLQAFHEHHDALARAARGMGFDLHRVSTHEWLGPTLAAFVARRNAAMRRGGRGAGRGGGGGRA
jgi:uncharacterized protein (DUF58 family)